MPDLDVDPQSTAPPTPPAETPAPPAPPVETPPEEPHALEPGGDRFKQVWARAKTAEERARALESDLQREREERIRYEERLKAQEAAPVKKEPTYTWTQLEDMITNGTLTRAQANEYREGVVKREWQAEAEKTLQARLDQADRARRVTTDLDRYKQLVPNIVQAGTAERAKVEAEYRYMTGVLGMPASVATELAASRAAFGDLSVLERTRQAESSTRDNREATVETTTSGKAPDRKTDPIKDLDARQREHYERMIKKGRYPNGWADVRAELSWTRGAKKS